MVIAAVFEYYETVVEYWDAVIEIWDKDTFTPWEVELGEAVGDSAVPVTLDDRVRILLFPKLLIILVPIIINKLRRSFYLLSLNNSIQLSFILHWASENIFLQWFGVGDLVLLLGERIQSLNLDFGFVDNIRNALLAVLSVGLGVAHVFKR